MSTTLTVLGTAIFLLGAVFGGTVITVAAEVRRTGRLPSLYENTRGENGETS